MSTAAIVGGSLASAGIGAGASLAASGAQAGAAQSAAQLQAQSQANSLAEQQREFNITQGNLAPFLKAGTAGVNTLSQLLSTPGQGLLTPWTGTFQAPTAAQAAATPGYQFLAGAGTGAIQSSAAGAGNLLSTGTLKSLAQFNQGLADTTYSETYNRAFNQYLQQYNQFQNNQTNEFNRLASISGLGQQTATTLGNLGQSAASNIANINATAGSQIGNSLLYGGAAQASGYAGLANAVGGGIGNIGQYLLLQNLLGGGGGSLGGIPANPNPGYIPPGAVTGPNPGTIGVPT